MLVVFKKLTDINKDARLSKRLSEIWKMGFARVFADDFHEDAAAH